MKKTIFCCFLSILTFTIFAQKIKNNSDTSGFRSKRLKKSELEKIPEPNTFAIQASFDNAFGFRPTFNASIGYDNTKSLTFYGTAWNSESPSVTVRPQILRGNSPWVEAGVGASIKFFKKSLILKPQLGIVSGSFLNGEKTLIGEGITPSLSIYYQKNNIDFELKGSGYFTIRSGASTSKDLLMIHAAPSIALKKGISIGGHLEHFSTIHPNTNTQIFLVGGFMKVKIADKYEAKFLIGKNMTTYSLYSSEIARLSVGVQLF